MTDLLLELFREAADATGNKIVWSDGSRDFIEAFADLVAAAEREACIKVCEETGDPHAGREFAEAIRALGK